MANKTVKQHYEEHLSSFYGWMLGDFEARVAEQFTFFNSNHITPVLTGRAVDLGAGTGIQTCALAALGFKVMAVDFDKQLLGELQTHCNTPMVTVHRQDMLEFVKDMEEPAELITCMGDTLTHLKDMEEVRRFLADCFAALLTNGKLILTFRNYTAALHGNDRFISVKSDDLRILTCMLEYYPAHVLVTDLLYEKTRDGWKQRISSYTKVRINPIDVVGQLKELGMQIVGKRHPQSIVYHHCAEGNLGYLLGFRTVVGLPHQIVEYMRRTIAAVAILSVSIITVYTTGCTNSGADIVIQQQKNKTELLERGQYLVTIGGCNDCHTPKMMTEHGVDIDPTRMLSGHIKEEKVPAFDVKGVSKGIVQANMNLTAWQGPWGTSFAANITPDKESGIGNWTLEQFKTALRKGKSKGLPATRPLLPPMPWFNFAKNDR